MSVAADLCSYVAGAIAAIGPAKIVQTLPASYENYTFPSIIVYPGETSVERLNFCQWCFDITVNIAYLKGNELKHSDISGISIKEAIEDAILATSLPSYSFRRDILPSTEYDQALIPSGYDLELVSVKYRTFRE